MCVRVYGGEGENVSPGTNGPYLATLSEAELQKPQSPPGQVLCLWIFHIEVFVLGRSTPLKK